MGKELFEELVNAIRNNSVYDFIANNYWKLRNEDLKDIALEAIYMYQSAGARRAPNKVEKEEAIEKLKERLSIEE